MTKIGEDLIQSGKEALLIAKRKLAPGRVVKADEIDVAAIRRRTGLSQVQFAARFGLSAATVRDWEQRRRRPDRTARTLLLVIEKNPDAVAQALT